MYSMPGEPVERQGSHRDFKRDEGFFGLMACLADNVMFEYTRADGQKVRVKCMKGDIIVFNSQLDHNGPAYGKPLAENNLFLRFHSYCELRPNEETSDKLIIHLKQVKWLPCVVPLPFTFLTCLCFCRNPVQFCDGEDIEYDGDEPGSIDMGCKCHKVLEANELTLENIKGVSVIVEPVAGG